MRLLPVTPQRHHNVPRDPSAGIASKAMGWCNLAFLCCPLSPGPCLAILEAIGMFLSLHVSVQGMGQCPSQAPAFCSPGCPPQADSCASFYTVQSPWVMDTLPAACLDQGQPPLRLMFNMWRNCVLTDSQASSLHRYSMERRERMF